MRAIFALCLLAGACERDVRPPAPAPTVPSDAKSISARLADELVKLGPEQVLALPDLGWLQMKRYLPYEGRNPRTSARVSVPEAWRPFWHSAPGPWDRRLTDERRRFLVLLHGDDAQAIADEDPAIQVSRFPWTDATCEAAAQELAAKHTTTLAGLGTFTLLDGEVRYKIAPELEQRLAARR